MIKRKSKHTIAVILKNKIGALDIILPLLMDVSRRNSNVNIEFHTIHGPTYQAIKDNPVLWDAVHEIGMLPDYNKSGRLGSKIAKAWMLFRLAILGLMGRVHFIHFKELAMWPLRILYCVAPKRTFYIRDGAYGSPEALLLLMRLRQNGGPYLFKPNADKSGLQIFFHRDSLGYDGVARDAPLVIARPPRIAPVWLEFIAARAKQDLKAELLSAGFDPDSDVIGFMVTEPYESETHKIYGLRAADSLPMLFDETLDVLVEEAAGLPILIRSQLAIDFPYIDEQIRKRSGANIIRSDLHASVIASRSKFFITNWFTTTLADARSAGVPTIEYSDYSDRLKTAFAGGPSCPDWVLHFINRDKQKLRAKVRELLDNDEPAPPITMDYDEDIDIVGILASSAPWHVQAHHGGIEEDSVSNALTS